MWIDAHNHLQRLGPNVALACEEAGIVRAVVNGTSEADWDAVANLARKHTWIIPSFGIHPWYAPGRTNAWPDKLIALLEEFPHAGVGEIGLDRWMENADLDDQRILFREQMEIAAERKRAATVHCVRAWAALLECEFPVSSFLLHAYGGPREMVAGFAKRGAFFSFNGCFLDPKKIAKLETFREVPRDRLLMETDAPDLLLPPELETYTLSAPNGTPLNHPANLPVAYRELARFLGEDAEQLAAQVCANFQRLFGVA